MSTDVVAKIDKRMVRARASLIQKHPFWGTLAMHLRLVEDPGCGTMWVDGENLGYDPLFLDELSERELEGVNAHEIAHCAYLHHTRRGTRDIELWNDACDYAINRDLIKGGFILPKGVLLDPQYDGMAAEAIYAILDQKRQAERQQQAQQQGQEQQGGQSQPQPGQSPASGHKKGSGRAPNPCGEVRDAAKPGNEASKARSESNWRVRVMQAMGVERADHAGDIPGDLLRMYEAVRKRPVDWRSIVRRFIDARNRQDYSWTSPNKRMLGYGFVLPGLVPDGVNHLGIVVDTSCSVNKRALGLFVNEVQATLDDGAVSHITIICIDTRVQARYDFYAGDVIKFEPKGGGGTRFSPAIAWFQKHEPDVAALIYFTDLDCNDYGPQPDVPMIWVGYGTSKEIAERTKKVPFGEVIPLID